MFARSHQRIGRNGNRCAVALVRFGIALPTSMPRDSVRLTQAYSIAFQLLSMAEQNASVQFRREIESTQGIDAVPALWGESLKRLLEQGCTAEEIAASLHKMQVELVLTAHPTEAKRAHVLAHHRRLFERFVLRDRADLSPGNFEENEEVIRALIASCGAPVKSISTSLTCSPNDATSSTI